MEEIALPFAEELREADRLSRSSEARKVLALGALAEVYRVGHDDLMPILAERRLVIGLDGPTVSEFLCLEVGALLGISPSAAAGKIAEAVAVKHRHPGLLGAVEDLQVDPARACRAAVKCMDLPSDVANRVTNKWLETQHKLSWTSAFNLLTKLIVAEDPEAAAEKERKAREQLGVHIWGQYNGTMNLTGRLNTLDARYVDAAVTRIAEILEVEDPDSPKDNLRARAMGILANPAYALALLQQAAQPTFDEATATTAVDGQGEEPQTSDAPDTLAAAQGQIRLDHGTWEASGSCDGLHCFGASTEGPYPVFQRNDPHDCLGHLCGTITTPLHKLRPQLGIAVHLSLDAVGHLEGSARIEKAGAVTLATLKEWLGDVDFQVLPVIDLENVPPEDRYKPSTAMMRAVRLAMPKEMFPWSNRSSTGLDLDHTAAYRPAVPDAQTRIGNLAPFSRRVHRAKTAGIWKVSQPKPALLQWKSPLGYCYEVTNHGARKLE